MPQFVITAYDGTDPDAYNRRMKARDAHVQAMDALRREGKILIGVALTDEAGKMIGSLMVMNFDDRPQLDAWLAQEPYVVQKVWDQISIVPGKIGPSFVDLVKVG